jgi:3-hydroxyisobutyrate dehydrogenase-like beta-hydroxyacid dehydrogenase
MPAQPKIAFIGTGIMGSHMARRLGEAGLDVTAWNRSAAKVEALASAPVQRATSVRDAVAGAEFIIVMLSTGDVIDEVLFSGEAPIEGIAVGATLVVMSSVPVDTCRRQAEDLRRRGAHYVDAPVSGGEVGARDGTLAILAGGDADIVESLAPMLKPLGRATHLGPVGAGQAAKLANQIIVGSTMAAVAEALHFAARNGADPAKVRNALAGGFGDSKILHLHGTRMVERDFAPGSPAEYQLKDLRAAQALAKSLSLDLTLLNTLAAMFGDMIEHEGTGIDVSGILLEVERRSTMPAT